MTLALTLLAALVLIFGAWISRDATSKRATFDTLTRQEVVTEGRRHARERHRRTLQIARGILRRENGLGVVVAPRPARAISGKRAERRRWLRRMTPVMRAKIRGLSA